MRALINFLGCDSMLDAISDFESEMDRITSTMHTDKRMPRRVRHYHHSEK